ncbi:aspartyl/asparaginyl beta-hydroxylase domain-containing protein [Kitasatospora fiedleri]|uniref:aspartyl/asparaginyl beta-hydroxylase domain-containing protein n=1 Tax=Kitasatospora fiedleri TaxID=2991545 RepID=UPI00249CB8E6|nr:aspartyl/asparaginyl beta-hydroxylase domain-containing protein [Kitasatospora fiedleri]
MQQRMATPAFSRLPRSARLDGDFDVVRLGAELAALRQVHWHRRRRYPAQALTAVPEQWRTLPLRSIGGDPERTDAGGPDRDDFADTPWLAGAPYLAEVLDALPAAKRAVRLMALTPGASGAPHRDTKNGLAWGTVRLYLPLTAHPGAGLVIEGEPQQWTPGTLWYGDVSRSHRLLHPGTDGTPVHLVADLLPNRALLDLFPPVFRTPEVLAESILARPPAPLDTAARAAHGLRFDVPESFTDRDEADGAFLRHQRRLPGTVLLRADRLFLTAPGEPELGLVHLGGGEFRFAGWTEERTLRLPRPGEVPAVVLRTRCGGTVRETAVPARHDT